MSENDNFIRQYAAEIAQALREQDEAPRTPLVEDSIHSLYRALCFDEPVIEESILANIATVVSALNRQLLNKSSPYALSNRLVNGIVNVCQQQKQKRGEDSKVPTAFSTAMAKLAFCVLIQLPLECCQQLNNEVVVRQYLGSYKGTETVERQEQASSQEVQPEEAKLESLLENLNETTNDAAEVSEPVNTAAPGNDTGSLEEVWAAESDPSDFDYGESSEPISLPTLPTEEEDWLDPKFLSRPDPTMSMDQIRVAIVSILKFANYSLMEPLFRLSKKELEPYLMQLTQLLLMLLQPNSPFLSETFDVSAHSALLSPLWVLRDAAAASQSQTFFTTTYLELLQTLLAMDQAHLQDSAAAATTAKAEQLCVSSIVGLSAFASWCSSSGINVQLTNTAIIEAMNDFAHVAERASSSYQDNLTQTLVPILESLTGINHDQQLPRLSQSAPQMLLNSGLMRQLLSITILSKESHARHHFDHAIWGLCVTYPTTVGKYAARYPDFASLVRRYGQNTASDCVYSVLWNAFGYTQCGSNNAPRVVWKSTAKQEAAPPLTQDECQAVCQKAWDVLCRIVRNAAQESIQKPQDALQVIQEWTRLRALMGVSSLFSTFGELLDRTPMEAITSTLQELAQQSSPTGENETRVVSEEEEDDDDDKPTEESKKKVVDHHLVAAEIRKTLKQYNLLFEGTSSGTSKTD